MKPGVRAAVLLIAAAGLVWAFRPKPIPSDEPAIDAVPLFDGPGHLIVDLADGASEADLATIEGIVGADLSWTSDLSIDEGLAEGDVPDMDDAVAMLSGNPLVEVAEPLVVMEAMGFPNDPLYEKQWHLRAMGAPEGWAATPRGKGVIVAVVDTGVTVVEDLDPKRVMKGATFVPGTKTAADGNGHGTHVSGTIAQWTDNGKGTAGVAPEATILPIKALSDGGFGSSSWIASGIDEAVDQGADVINLSLGGGYSGVIHNAIKKARAQGVIVVAAAGNSGRRGVSWPGALKECLGVSATGPDGLLAPYSSWGQGVDISAPGGNKQIAGGGVWQDTIDRAKGHDYKEFQGTSMATPHVAGAAAVLLSTGTCDATCVERTLLGSAKGNGGWDEKYGRGQLDLGSALSHVTDRSGGIRFGLGALFALIMAQMAGGGSRFRALATLFGAWAAGGLFFLHMVPLLPDGTIVRFLATAPLAWPSLVLGPWWSSFPPWCSAALPIGVAFTLGAFRGTRPFALGLACGIGAHLLHAAATGSLEPWFLPSWLGTLWLATNATVCLVIGLALAGTEKLDAEKRT